MDRPLPYVLPVRLAIVLLPVMVIELIAAGFYMLSRGAVVGVVLGCAFLLLGALTAIFGAMLTRSSSLERMK